jgi:GT2 family glycosyltransferase
MWGTHFRQRLRLAPLYVALAAADRAAAVSPRRSPQVKCGAWRPGISMVIPDRDAPDLLHEALASIGIALEAITEPVQIVVVANGAPRERYQAVLEKHPFVELIHSPGPLGFSAAIGRGLAAARYDWTLLLNNDMTLEPDALRELAARRAEDVFAIAAQKCNTARIADARKPA